MFKLRQVEKAIFLFNMTKGWAKGSIVAEGKRVMHLLHKRERCREEKRKEGKLLVKYTDKEPILMQKLP